MATLVALADGSLDERGRDAAERLVASSPELRSQLAAQRRAVEVLRSLEIRAPEHLRARVAASRPQARCRPRWRIRFAAAGLAAAVAAVLLALLLPSGASAPSVLETAGLAEREPSAPAPRPDPHEPRLLAATNAGVAYPNYRAAFGWRAAGTRTDELGDRRVRTVFYARRGRRIAYSIVSGPPLAPAPSRRVARAGPVTVRLTAHEGRSVASWVRQGHTCVLSGAGTTGTELAELAGWSGEGAVRF